MKKTLLALVVLGGLFGAYFYVSHRPEKGAPKPRIRPMPHFTTNQIEKVEITKDGSKIVLARVDAEAFRIAEPVDYPADKSATKAFFEKLEKMQFGDTVTDKPEKHAEFEVTDEKGTRVTLLDKDGKTKADFYVGAMKEGYTMIRNADRNQVVQAVGAVKSIFGRDLKGWRDKTILQFERNDVQRIEVQSPTGKYVLRAERPEKPAGADQPVTVGENAPKPRKTDDKPTWKLDSAPFAVGTLDEGVPQGMMTALYGLKASDFADDVKPSDAGLTTPAWTITIVTKDAAQTLQVGSRTGDKDDEFFVKRADKPQIFRLKKSTVDRIARRPIDLREKKITTFKDDDVEQVEIAMGSAKGGDRVSLKRTGKEWSSTPSVKLDDSKVQALVSTLSELEGTGYADAAQAKKAGLGKPRAVVTVRLKDKSKVTIRIGAQTEDNDVFLARDGRSDLFFVKKHTAERLLKKAADFEKSATPSRPMPGGPMGPGMPGGMPPGMMGQ